MSTASSPPQSILTSPITAATTTTTTSPAHHVVHSQSQQSHRDQHPQQQTRLPQQTIHSTLPSAETQRDITLARSAVVASLGNMVDGELQTRASTLHANAAALDRQERDVLAATASLRREREKLAKEASTAAKKLKELGNVQNWAEVLEGKFLVLEETIRLANGGREYREGEDSSRGSSCSCSCSDCGDQSDIDEGRAPRGRKGSDPMGGHDGRVDAQETWSDTSHSLNDPESSMGTGTARGSDVASMSTTS